MTSGKLQSGLIVTWALAHLAAAALVPLPALAVSKCVDSLACHVSETGRSAGSGTYDDPIDLSSANSWATAGITYSLLPGTYTDQYINPGKSGIESARIIYQPYDENDPPVFTGSDSASDYLCFKIKGRSYVTVKGITCTGGTAGSSATVRWGAKIYGGAANNVVEHCKFQYVRGTGIVIQDASEHNIIKNNAIDTVFSYDEESGEPLGNGLSIVGSDGNLIQGNAFTSAGHNLFSIEDGEDASAAEENIIRGNYFSNPWHRVGTISGNAAHNVVEYNVIENASTVEDQGAMIPEGCSVCAPVYDSQAWKIQGTSANVYRNNVIRHNGNYGFQIRASENTTASVKNQKIYHNVFYKNGHAGFGFLESGEGSSASGNRLVNNLFYGDGHASFDRAMQNCPEIEIAETQGTGVEIEGCFAETDGFGADNLATNNGIAGHLIGGSVSYYSASAASHIEVEAGSLEENAALAPAFSETKSAAAVFAYEGNPFLNEYGLDKGSAFVDGGAFLTAVTAVSTSGSQSLVTVSDASYFSDGAGMVDGDVLKFQDTSGTYVVSSVDYASNTLTVSGVVPPLVVGKGLSLNYDGNAPDIGIIETRIDDPFFFACSQDAAHGFADADGDGENDDCDGDADGDGFANDGDNCPSVANSDQKDSDSDMSGDACDDDRDGDGIANAKDNCADAANAPQSDLDKDGKGDKCDNEADGDGVRNAIDCKPYNKTVYPGAVEIVGNGKDENCDGVSL